MNDIINNYDLNNIKNIFKHYLSTDNILISILAIYVVVLSIYAPRHIISLINHPFSKLLILMGILYTSTYNLTLGLFIAIALITTINLDNSISVMEERFIPNIKETFEVKKIKDSDKRKVKHSEELDSEEVDDEETNEEDESDSDSDSDDDDETEEFDVNKLKPSKNLDDTFTKLHGAIHELENFYSKENK